MSKCEFQILLSKTEFHPGETISGEVIVKVLEPFQCTKLLIELLWHTTGRGNTASKSIAQKVAFSGEYQPGEYSYPFSFTAPKGPFNYSGKTTSVAWYLKVSADVPWAIDPTVETMLTLSPRPEMSAAEPYFFGPLYRAKPDPIVRMFNTFLMPLLRSAGIEKPEQNEHIDLTHLSTETGSPSAVESSSPVGQLLLWLLLAFFAFTLIVAVPFFLLFFSPFLIYALIKRWMVQQKIGTPQIKVSSYVLCRGGEVTVSVEFTTQQKINFGKMYVSLESTEIVTRGSGKNSSTTRETVYQNQAPLLVEEAQAQADAYRDAPDQKRLAAAKQEAKQGEVYLLSAKFLVDESVPFTFAASSNHIQNKIQLHVEMKDWPDWKEERTVTIRPGRALKSQ